MVAIVRRSNGLIYRQDGTIIRATAASLAAYRRCCCTTINCCDILVNFPELIVTGDIEGTPQGTPQTGWAGEVSVPSGEFSIADFRIYCVEGSNGRSGTFRVTFHIENSSGVCETNIDESFTQQSPCCPLTQEFNVPIPVGCDLDGILTFTLKTPDNISCPEN